MDRGDMGLTYGQRVQVLDLKVGWNQGQVLAKRHERAQDHLCQEQSVQLWLFDGGLWFLEAGKEFTVQFGSRGGYLKFKTLYN